MLAGPLSGLNALLVGAKDASSRRGPSGALLDEILGEGVMRAGTLSSEALVPADARHAGVTTDKAVRSQRCANGRGPGSTAPGFRRQEKPMPSMVIRCECGHLVHGGGESELLAAARDHIAAQHPELVGRLSDEDLRQMTRQE